MFISATFELDDELAEEVGDLAGTSADDVRLALIQRDLGGKAYVTFPNADPTRTVPTELIKNTLAEVKDSLQSSKPMKSEEATFAKMIAAIDAATGVVEMPGEADAKMLTQITEALAKADSGTAPKTAS